MTTPRRDPAGRRAAILEAALTVIARDGVARASHRAIATEAAVPLGSTTYYFPSLNALIEEALALCTARMVEQLSAWADELHDDADLAAGIARVAYEYIADRDRALVEYELYLSAARAPQLRQAARAWIDGMRALLLPRAGHDAAVAITAVIDGFLLEAIATGDTVSRTDLTAAIAAHLR